MQSDENTAKEQSMKQKLLQKNGATPPAPPYHLPVKTASRSSVSGRLVVTLS